MADGIKMDALDKPAEMANKMVDNSANVANNTANMATNALNSGMQSVSNSTETIKETLAPYLQNTSTVLYGLIILALLALIVGYFLYVLITDNIIYQQRVLVEGTEAPVICNEMSEFKITQHLSNTNGKRRTYSFWIYINDINKYAGDQHRHIAHVGSDHKSIIDSSPYIVLDKVSNKIHVRLAPTDDKTSASENVKGKLNDIDNIDELLKYTPLGGTQKNCGFTIEYVPIQRWVHVAFALTDNNNGAIYIYIDGELTQIKEYKLNTFDMNIAALKLDNKGDLFVGGNVNDTTNGVTGFSGLISKFTIYNYDLNQNDIFKEYNNGPFSGMLTSLGLGAYGLRSPIYKLNSAS
jgi:hypothetical protein